MMKVKNINFKEGKYWMPLLVYVLSLFVGYFVIDTFNLDIKDTGNANMWLIRQKENLESYLNDLETCLNDAAKKRKERRMTVLSIESIFKDSMKDYPDLEYEFIEQKKRLRIKVRMPNSKLGVILDAWWGSYQKKLPKEIEDLKTLIEAHSKTSQMNFYIIHKQEKN